MKWTSSAFLMKEDHLNNYSPLESFEILERHTAILKMSLLQILKVFPFCHWKFGLWFLILTELFNKQSLVQVQIKLPSLGDMKLDFQLLLIIHSNAWLCLSSFIVFHFDCLMIICRDIRTDANHLACEIQSWTHNVWCLITVFLTDQCACLETQAFFFFFCYITHQ